MKTKLFISSSPHVRSALTTRRIMLDVILALIPCVIAGTVIFGPRALLVVSFCVVSCVLMEYVSRMIMHRKQSIDDLSAVVTGLLLGLSLPVSMANNLHLTLVGSFTSIVVVKQMFGGIGNNFVNPALAGRIIMLVSFPSQMTDWSSKLDIDGITSATPLISSSSFSYVDLFIGKTGGCIGETCVIAILIGCIYLLARKVIKPIIPLCYVGSFSVIALILSLFIEIDVIAQILSGGLLICAVFMATDYVTSPVTNRGKVIYGIGCGALTVLIRLFASLPEGASYAVILMNITVPLIERISIPKAFGKKVTAND